MTKIIVVDDDLTNLGLTKMLLELDGFDVAACNNLDQARQAAATPVDALMVDVNLAGGESGLTLLRDVRAGETAVPENTVVIITSGDQRRAQEARAAGATHFLLKPYPPDTLSQLILDLIERAQNG